MAAEACAGGAPLLAAAQAVLQSVHAPGTPDFVGRSCEQLRSSGHGQIQAVSPNSSRPISQRRISLVPAPIS